MCAFLFGFDRSAAYIRQPDVAELNHKIVSFLFIVRNQIKSSHVSDYYSSWNAIANTNIASQTQCCLDMRNCRRVGIVRQAGWNEHINIGCCSCCCLNGCRWRRRDLSGQSMYRWWAPHWLPIHGSYNLYPCEQKSISEQAWCPVSVRVGIE